ncbi:MAG: hypothetical protein JWQ18_1288 [Conexibacter sp.]|nr:hypothetical protein [Conexibacter sp.]
MDGPIQPPDHTNLLARRSVEEEQGLSPERPSGARLVALRVFAVLVVLGAIASIAYVIAVSAT